MKLAYVITAHKNPQQLRRLIEAIYDRGNTYVLHIDSKASAEMRDAARQLGREHSNVTTIPGESIIWGSWRLAHAQIRAMDAALRFSSDWEYCLNLTAQDYPLRTQREIADALADGPSGANYLETLEFAKASPAPRKRMEYYFIPWRGKMRKTIKRSPRSDFEIFWGSNYFAFTREACEHLANSKISRRMQKYFRFALCADELIFQNAIMHSDLRSTIVSRTMRKLVWAGGSHPKTFTMADRDELLASDAWIARKFDEAVDSKILDELDANLKARGAL